MLKYPIVFGYCVLLLIIFNNAEVIVTVALNGSFRVQIFPKKLDNQKKCVLTSPANRDTIIPLDFVDSDSETTEYLKILPLGNNQCGAMIRYTNASDLGIWNLTLSNDNHERITEIFRIRIVPVLSYSNTTSNAAVGDIGAIITCGPASMMYCELRNPLGNIVPLTGRDRCQTTIEFVKPTDFGVWTCTVGVSGNTNEIKAIHTLKIGETAEEILIFSNKTSLGNLINWQIRSIIPAASWCRAFTPNGESILILPGLGTEKYISAGTDLNENKCGLLMSEEFSKEYIGLWRLEMGLTSGRILGGFIKMPEGELPGPNDPDTETESILLKTTELKVAAGHSFSITCQTEYTAGYCWIRGPRGQMYTSTNELSVGRCSYTNTSANLEDHNGNWTCNMAHVNGGREDHFVTKVNVIDKLFRAVDNEITVRRGHSILIGCHAVLETPLQYCRFIRPDGIGLGVSPEMGKSGDRYSYKGPGLDHGYCGLSISYVEEVDFGEWKCVSIASLRIWGSENFDTVFLTRPETSVASVIGLTFGAFMLIIFAVGFFILQRKRGRSSNIENEMIVGCNRN